MAKANQLEIEVIEATDEKPFPPEYAKLNPLGKIPSFEGKDGYQLTECIAIAIYCKCSDRVGRLVLPPASDTHTHIPCMMRHIIVLSVIPV